MVIICLLKEKNIAEAAEQQQIARSLVSQLSSTGSPLESSGQPQAKLSQAESWQWMCVSRKTFFFEILRKI